MSLCSSTALTGAVALRSLRPGDEAAAVRWAADPEFCQAADWTPGLAARVVRRHWQALIEGQAPDFHRWGVTLYGRLVGYVDLANLTSCSGELGVAIGDRTLWGQGVATAACRLLLQEAWALGLEQVDAHVHAPNERSQALMRRLGFQAVGMGPPKPYRGSLVPVTHFLRSQEGC
ncbi:GNAT family N-acetyltransferase [Deinococcus hohokamensis]|uniref:GNAT family N-acetyltransferase n=1 Tax=Deinococcus hohokamensis TaxID=309883 RepID=A0ABV9IAS8_9DEIO